MFHTTVASNFERLTSFVYAVEGLAATPPTRLTATDCQL